jgi:hypothetical protein
MLRARVELLLVASLLLAAPVAASAEQAVNCAAEPEGVVKGNLLLNFAIDSETSWQPPGGEIRFNLKGRGMPSDDMEIRTCFRWHRLDAPAQWRTTPPLRVIDAKTDEITFGAQVPEELLRDAPNWLNFGKAQQVAYTGLGLVPLADFHVVAASPKAPWSRLDIVQQVGITSVWFSFTMALLAIVVAWSVFFLWGAARGVKGGPILRVIASRNGVASLSQFQIIIWTFVIGAGVIYVMALSGSMIDIPTATLALLGIAGVATVGSQLQAASGDTPKPTVAPGAVTGLAVSGAAGSDRVVLNWTPASGADPTVVHTVQFRQDGAIPWLTASSSVAGPPYAVTGLMPNTGYQFQVFAVNAAGSGPASPMIAANTAAGLPTNPAAPAQVAGVTAAAGPQPESQIQVTWSALAPAPSAYTVQYRPGGTLAWATASTTAAPPFSITGLASGTEYEFQVFAVTAGVAGMPSALTTAATAPRTPRWSDLVMAGNGRKEVDVTRVQMLLFTVIAAIFVTLKLVVSSQIPDIPPGILMLIGISNGVYLTAKFAPTPK